MTSQRHSIGWPSAGAAIGSALPIAAVVALGGCSDSGMRSQSEEKVGSTIPLIENVEGNRRGMRASVRVFSADNPKVTPANVAPAFAPDDQNT